MGKLQLVEQSAPLMSVEIEHAYRFTCRFAKLAHHQQRRKMIARWHVPFACADENSRLLVCWQRKVPSLILDRVGGWNKRHCCGIAFRTNALINFRGLGSSGDAAICFCHNFYEARQLRAVAQLLRDLME